MGGIPLGGSARRPARWLLVALGFVFMVCWPAEPIVAASSAQVLDPGQVVEAAPLSASASAATPADGRLRGPDFTAVVTRVAWPQSVSSGSGTTYAAGAGHRLVAFTLAVTQATDDSGLLNSETSVNATMGIAGETLSVPMASIDHQIASGSSGTAQTTGTDTFVASVTTRDKGAALGLTESSFAQDFDLWTLQRFPASPILLYRDPTTSSITGSASGPFHLAFTNPADGFSSTDDAQVSSASLTYFGPGGTFPRTTPGNHNPDTAFLEVALQSSYPSVPYGQPDSGHFFSSFTPLPGDQLTFTPTGGTAVTATADTTDFSSTSAAADDDGIFDALYLFTVPATLTGGTLGVTPGTVSGTEYTGFTGTGTAVPIDVSAPATVSLSFPAVPASPDAQKKPPWVGAPLPATGSAATPGSPAGASGSSSGFPIWVAVLLLVLVAAGVVVFQRMRRGATPAAVVNDSPVSVRPAGAVPVVVAESNSDSTPDAASPRAPIRPREPLTVSILGIVLVTGSRQHSDRRIIEELLVYLACHDGHHRNAEQIQAGIWPTPGKHDDVARKTFHNYLSELRACVGAEYLPDAKVAGGYLLQGVHSDWAEFQRLTRQADTEGGQVARALRTEALSLVRGVPFEGAAADTYEWVGAEHLASAMTVAIATCASGLGEELFEMGDLSGAEGAARAGLRGAPDDYALWALGARAIHGRDDRTALRRWMTDASEHLEPGEIGRIEDELRPHDDDPQPPEM